MEKNTLYKKRLVGGGIPDAPCRTPNWQECHSQRTTPCRVASPEATVPHLRLVGVHHPASRSSNENVGVGVLDDPLSIAQSGHGASGTPPPTIPPDTWVGITLPSNQLFLRYGGLWGGHPTRPPYGGAVGWPGPVHTRYTLTRMFLIPFSPA